jgi:hypothetical protein
MGILRRRPTALVWYARLRALNLILLTIATIFYLALFINPRLARPTTNKVAIITVRMPLDFRMLLIKQVIFATIPNGFELHSALRGDISNLRSQKSLIALIITDILLIIGFCLSALSTGVTMTGAFNLLNALFVWLLILS